MSQKPKEVSISQGFKIPKMMKTPTMIEYIYHTIEFVGHRLRLFGKVADYDVDAQCVKITDPLMTNVASVISIDTKYSPDLSVQCGSVYEFICDCKFIEESIVNDLVACKDASALDLKLFYYTNILVNNFLEEINPDNQQKFLSDANFLPNKLIKKANSYSRDNNIDLAQCLAGMSGRTSYKNTNNNNGGRGNFKKFDKSYLDKDGWKVTNKK